MKLVAACIVAAAISLSGCAGHMGNGSSRVVATSDAGKPDWVEKRVFERGEQLFFVGTIAAVRDLALGEEQAEYQAKKTIASAIRETFQREFSTATTGANSTHGGPLGQSIASALSAATDQVRIVGAWPVERYWERVETQADQRVETSYNVAVLVRLDRREYERAKAEVLDATSRADQLRANEEARQVLERVRLRLTNP